MILDSFQEKLIANTNALKLMHASQKIYGVMVSILCGVLLLVLCIHSVFNVLYFTP